MNEKKRSLMASSCGAMENEAIHQPQLALKCPRCDSSNTKFCYYNNYSLSQPRHFCKACKRYWTRGGTLRNVPVGGGCRKNKRVKIRPPVTNTTGAKDELPSTNNRIVNPILSASAHHQLGGLGFSSAGQLLINGGEVNYYYSSSSSCPSMTSLLASTIQHQKLISSGGDLELKDDYSSLKPLLCPSVKNGSGLAVAAMNKVDGEMNYPVGGNGWNNYLGYQNHEMEVIGLSSLSPDPNYYWSMSNANTTPSNNWHHPPTNTNEPSVPSLL